MREYTLDFGDGSPLAGPFTETQAITEYTYNLPGTYTVTATSTAPDGEIQSRSVTVVVTRASVRVTRRIEFVT